MDYYIPPDDYKPPTHCETCGEIIFYSNVVGGQMWLHVALTEHVVVMRPEGWWDTSTGDIRYGNGSERLLDV